MAKATCKNAIQGYGQPSEEQAREFVKACFQIHPEPTTIEEIGTLVCQAVGKTALRKACQDLKASSRLTMDKNDRYRLSSSQKIITSFFKPKPEASTAGTSKTQSEALPAAGIKRKADAGASLAKKAKTDGEKAADRAK